MTVRDSSRDAYADLRDTGKLGVQEKKIMLYFHAHPGHDFTRSELAFLTGIRLSAICGRCFNLIRLGYLDDDKKRLCKQTGRNVHALRVRAAQLELLEAA